MKAIIIKQPGDVEQLQLEDIAELSVPEGFVKIRNTAFGLEVSVR